MRTLIRESTDQVQVKDFKMRANSSNRSPTMMIKLGLRALTKETMDKVVKTKRNLCRMNLSSPNWYAKFLKTQILKPCLNKIYRESSKKAKLQLKTVALHKITHYLKSRNTC